MLAAIEEMTMAVEIKHHWWGEELCLDEQTTLKVAADLAVGGTAAAIAALLFDPEGISRDIIAMCGLIVALGGAVILAVDVHGGSKGVCFYRLMQGNFPGAPMWVWPRK
jgi:hypothetical protein